MIKSTGSIITLTCVVNNLSPLVDVPVTVNTVWTGPDMLIINNITSQSVIASSTNYTVTSTVMVNLFGREQSGIYNCTVFVNSMMNSFILPGINSSMARLTIGKICITITKLLLHYTHM